MRFELLSVRLHGHHIGDILASADIYQSDDFVFHTLVEIEPCVMIELRNDANLLVSLHSGQYMPVLSAVPWE
jgi:hypothetical protein